MGDMGGGFQACSGAAAAAFPFRRVLQHVRRREHGAFRLMPDLPGLRDHNGLLLTKDGSVTHASQHAKEASLRDVNKRFLCGACRSRFSTKAGCMDHIRSKHQRTANVLVFEAVDEVVIDDEPSMADLAVEAEIDRKMGVSNDHHWLLP